MKNEREKYMYMENFNKENEKMIIKDYINSKNIIVYFPKYNYYTKCNLKNFKLGYVKCPYSRKIFGVGYLGEGEYISRKNGKITKEYDLWRGMLRRCYSKENKKEFNRYKDVSVCDEWLNFQNLAKWYNENYYEIEGQRMELDKDILKKNNKTYSPEYCVFVTSGINNLFLKNNKNRGKYPIGVSYNKKAKKFSSICNVNNKQCYLGLFDNSKDAFIAYKTFKENYIKNIANEYKEYIPNRLYEALLKYEIEITD